MKILKFTILPILVLSVFFVACAEEKEEYARPSYGSMTQEPNPAIPGQEVMLTFSQRDKGNGIAGTDYTWTISNLLTNSETGQRENYVQTIHDNYDGYGKQDPVLRFVVSANTPSGSYRVHLKAEFQGYVGDVLYDAASANGKLVVK